MLTLHRSKEFRLDRWSPVVLLYPFLVNQRSTAGMKLRALLRGYSGDLLQEIALKGVSEFRNAWDIDIGESALPYPFAEGSLRTAARYLGRPLHSGDLLTALIISPVNPLKEYDDALRDMETYWDLRNWGSISKGDIDEAVSEIALFFKQRKIEPSSVINALTDLEDEFEDKSDDEEGGMDSHRIHERYSLTIGLLPSGHLKVQILDRWGQHPFAEDQGLISAPHGLWVPESVVFLPSEIQEFEKLLNSKHPVPEEAYQEFFEAHPKWLFLIGEQYEKAIHQIRLPPTEIRSEIGLADTPLEEMWLRPDFLLKRIGLDLWDVLDIKASDCRMVVGKKSRRRFSQAVNDAVAQLREYSARLGENEVRKYLKEKYSLSISEPIAMIVIGRDFDFRTLNERSVLMSGEHVKIYTYDDLHRLARHRSLTV
jgi:hypothetical protein